MIEYNAKDWFTFIFRLHKSDTVRKLFPMLLAMAVYTAIIVFIAQDYKHISQSNKLKNITIMHTILGAVISLLLVFRTNTAYDRWWEGRKLLGSLVNSSRSLAIKIETFLVEPATIADKNYIRKLIGLYPFILRYHLLKKETGTTLFDTTDDNDSLELDETAKKLNTRKHLPNQVALRLTERVVYLYQSKHIDEMQFRILNEELVNFSNVCGACERIHNTPIPYSYSVFLKKFIFFYVMTLPFGFLFLLGYLSIPVVVFIFYVLASLELIAEEIEDPFGLDANDLPMHKIAKNIRKHVNEIINIPS